MSKARSFAGFLRDVPRLLARPVSLAEADTWIRRLLDEREDGFLDVAKRKIYGNPRSPYVPLLKMAQCEFGDLERLVRADGLEPALAKLYDAGVYVGFEEYKGRKPIVRGDFVLHADNTDFDNPTLGASIGATSGGSSGKASPFALDTDGLRHHQLFRALTDRAHGVFGRRKAAWWEILPSPTGVSVALSSAIVQNPIERWWYPPVKRPPLAAARYRAASELVVQAARRGGAQLPRPKPLRLDAVMTVARWAEATAKASGACSVDTGISRAVRVAAAAREHGIDLTGTTFVSGGEPLTPAKAKEIADAGARVYPVYYIDTECTGVGCVSPSAPDDYHLSRHAFGILARPQQLPGSGGEVDCLFLTTLLSTGPKVLLNVETDDYGVIGPRACGCPLEDLGLTDHIQEIYSFSKLTGEGITLVGSDMVRVLEEVLPSRFGGSAIDYQLVEEEDDRGMTRLTLRVAPGIAGTDDDFTSVLLSSLGTGPLAADVSGIWAAAKSVRVVRERPAVTERGKTFPLVTLRTKGRTRSK